MVKQVKRPLLISDCDEVLLHFISPFRDYLGEVHDLELRLESFALSGNIRHRATGEIPENLHIPALLDHFFETRMAYQPLVDGVVEALAHIRSFADILVLTNIEDHHHARRCAQLKALGLDFEIYSNQGPKGPAVADFVRNRARDVPVVFIDDLPPHHRSVAEKAPHVHRLHMVAEPMLRPLLPPAPDAHARIDQWAEALPWIEARLRGV